MDTRQANTEPAADADQTQPSRPAETAECRQAVRQAIQALPADQRAALVLKDIEGHSYESIADILQCPVGTVRSRLPPGPNAVEGIVGRVDLGDCVVP